MNSIFKLNPTEQMQQAARKIAQGFYYQALNNEGARPSNAYFDIGHDAIWSFLEAGRQEEAECAEMTRRTVDGERFDDWILDETIRFRKTEATTKETRFGRTIAQGARNNLYRGECQQYPHSRSTLMRKVAGISDSDERLRYKLLASMRTAAFGDLLIEFDTVQRWCGNYDVDPAIIPLAQHYGIETPMLDFTDDFATALFFATCKPDETTGVYRPLDANEVSPGGANEFGVIFHMPMYQADMAVITMMGAPKDSSDFFSVDPIGFQPFMRCHMQHSYGVMLSNEGALQDNLYFEKLRFKQSVELSREVFDFMEGGERVFPYEGLNAIEGVIDGIRNAWDFSQNEFELGYVIASNYANCKLKNLDEALALLSSGQCRDRTITVGKVPKCYSLSEQARINVDRGYEGYNLEKASGSPMLWSKPRPLV